MANAERSFRVVGVMRDPDEGHFIGRVRVGKDVLPVHCRHGSWMMDTDDERFTMRDVLPDVAAELAGKARQIERSEGRRGRRMRRK